MTCHIHEKKDNDCVLCVPKAQLTKLCYLMRFRLELWECDSINDMLKTLDNIKKDLLFFDSLNLEYDNGGNDYHFFEIQTSDQNLIDELKARGFYELNE